MRERRANAGMLSSWTMDEVPLGPGDLGRVREDNSGWIFLLVISGTKWLVETGIDGCMRS